MSEYAFLKEIWHDPVTTKGKPAQCSLYSKRDGKPHQLDNIMDAYIHEPRTCQETTTEEEEYVTTEAEEECQRPRRRKQPTKVCFKENEEITGYEDSSLLKNAYMFDSYYADELDTTKVTTRNTPQVEEVEAQDVLCEEEDIPKPISREEIYKDIVERFAAANQDVVASAMGKNNYIELGVYIFSGILLIFMMEQILQVGRRLK